MNVLWLTNIVLPEASQLMNEKPTPFGGWFVSASAYLADVDGIRLSIAFPKNGLSDVQLLQGDKINYFTFPPVSEKDIKSNKQNTYLKRILEEAQPDIVHIFGTECLHTLAMVNAARNKNIKVAISIQGLASIIARHSMAGLSTRVQSRFTLRDFIRQDSLKQHQNKIIKYSKYEIEALQKVKHAIGRTTWDKACSLQINANIQYHYCNEVLRDAFYNHTWSITRCERHSIFVSQGNRPLKGLHFMLEAMPLILKNFPNTKLYISGQNVTKSDNLKEKLKITSYGKYIKELLREYNLEKKVIFTGLLDETQMCEQYLKSHMFVSCSTVENESNSLSEAKILGVPCVASYVGGVTDRILHGEDGFFYQHDAPYMLAHYVCEIFTNDELALQFSKKAREHAMKTHDREKNINRMIDIYKDIIGKSKVIF